MPVIPNNMSAREYLAEIGRRGGAAGKGRPKPKGQMRRAAEIRWAKDRERRDIALEVLGALIECEALLRWWRDGGLDGGHQARSTHERAALAIERATGAKPGQSASQTDNKPGNG